MLKNKRNETNESGKMMALTLALTNFLLLAVAIGAFRFVHTILNENHQLQILTRGFNLL